MTSGLPSRSCSAATPPSTLLNLMALSPCKTKDIASSKDGLVSRAPPSLPTLATPPSSCLSVVTCHPPAIPPTTQCFPPITRHTALSTAVVTSWVSPPGTSSGFFQERPRLATRTCLLTLVLLKISFQATNSSRTALRLAREEPALMTSSPSDLNSPLNIDYLIEFKRVALYFFLHFSSYSFLISFKATL